MRNYLKAFIAISALLSATGVYGQTPKQVVSVAKTIIEYPDQLQATNDIVLATNMYGPETVNRLCVAALASLSPSTFSVERIIPFLGGTREALVNQCITDFCASGGNHTDFSNLAKSQYCVEN